MSSKGKSSAGRGDGTVLVPRLRFPEFQEAAAWETAPGDELFQQVNNREAPPGLPILAITQEHGAIPRHMIDYHVSVTDKSLEAYKEVRPGDFIISLRSFQGGIEYSDYHGICSPAYVILRKRGRLSDTFYRQYFKSHDFIQQLTRNLEGLRDGKMISYKQFSELQLLKPALPEQQKIADCLDSADALIAAQGRRVEALRAHKKGLMQQLFPQEGETQPRLRFPNFGDEWRGQNLEEMCQSISSGKDKAAADGSFDLYGSTGIIGKTNNHSYSGIYLLVARVGANAGLLTKATGEFGVTDNTLVIVLKPQQNVDFLFYYIDQIGLNKMIFGSGQPLITGGQLKALTIQLPKNEEQQRIADCLTSLDDLITAETQKLDTLKTHKKGLMQQLFPAVGAADV
jgi:type I restriction enzyme S subunit